MGDRRAVNRSGLLSIRAITTKIFSPDSLANKIQNMSETARNTLKSIKGPAPYIPAYGQQLPQPSYQAIKGLFHGTLRDGEKEVLLAVAHNGTGYILLEFNGWNRSWSIAHEWKPDEPLSKYPEFPTQFEQCPNGIVVISQHDAVPRFYDEDGHCATLGYSKVPGAPSIMGPSNYKRYQFDSANINNSKTFTPNGDGFSVDGNIYSTWAYTGSDSQTQMHATFMNGRIGTTFSDGTVEASGGLSETSADNGFAPGILLSGAYNGAVQWVDKYGNFSAISPRSNTVLFTQASSYNPSNSVQNTAGLYGNNLAQPPENLLKQLMWQNISVCNEQSQDSKTVARNVYRTKDIKNNESATDLFLLNTNADGGVYDFASIPDNQSTIFVDNAPDGWISQKAPDVVPMQRFRLCKLAFGRMFYANSPEDSGLIKYSMKGRWGTILSENMFYPDPGGGPVTGMAAVKDGLLVFTESSSFLITDTSQETGFAVTTLSTTAGCVAPSSIHTTETGVTIWLGRNAFYAYQGGSIVYFSESIREDLEFLNTSRQSQAVASCDVATGEYRCWVATNSSKVNDTCYIYDARQPNTGWRTRTDIKASAVCVTKDHRGYMLAAGSVGTEPALTPHSVYVLDKEAPSTVYSLPTREYVIETNWLLNEDNFDSKSPLTVYLWMVETSSQSLNVEVYRDWRKSLVHTETVNLYYENDPPPFLGQAKLGSSTVRKNRPFWCKAKVFVPSCEVFKIILKSTSHIEFVGMSYEFVPHPAGGARVQK